jgi:hypothetical protein
MNHSSETRRQPTHWREILLALVPLLLIPALYLIGIVVTLFLPLPRNQSYLGLAMTSSVIGLPLILLVVGWVKEFPRWVFPYWGFVLTIALYMCQFDGTVSGFWVTGGLWVWAPLVGVILVSMLWTRSLRPVFVLVQTIWQDWTVLSFALYGALPLMFLHAYDEVRGKLVMIALMLVLSGSSYFYMRSQDVWRRFTWLVGGFSLSWLLLMIHHGVYWHGRWES